MMDGAVFLWYYPLGMILVGAGAVAYLVFSYWRGTLPAGRPMMETVSDGNLAEWARVAKRNVGMDSIPVRPQVLAALALELQRRRAEESEGVPALIVESTAFYSMNSIRAEDGGNLRVALRRFKPGQRVVILLCDEAEKLAAKGETV
jgi:hypothetical protein